MSHLSLPNTSRTLMHTVRFFSSRPYRITTYGYKKRLSNIRIPKGLNYTEAPGFRQWSNVKDQHGHQILKAASGNDTLPTLNVAALLDTKNYAMKFSASASTTKSGLGAARRLIDGQQDLLQFLKTHVIHPIRGVPTSFLTQGHGVPEQLLQDHVQMADQVLSNAFSAISFDKNSHEMNVRLKDGTNKSLQWKASEQITSSMQLYLTVMDRLATALQVFPKPTSPKASSFSDDYDNIFEQEQSLSRVNNDWSVEFFRGVAYPPQTALSPVVQWFPDIKDNGGRVSVKLQGKATETSEALTLCYTANFSN